MRIPASPDSPLAISRGTICLWLNVSWTDSGTILEYSNSAVQLRIYRRHLQPRFRGENRFNMGANVLGDDWPRFLLREEAFYPHSMAVVGEGQWHHFAVAYDDRSKRVTGWRDGELISVVDLSTIAVEPLKREDLKEIVTGNDFAGFIDDLRIYNRILSDDDVRNIFNSTRSVYAGRTDAIPTTTRWRFTHISNRIARCIRHGFKHALPPAVKDQSYYVKSQPKVRTRPFGPPQTNWPRP